MCCINMHCINRHCIDRHSIDRHKFFYNVHNWIFKKTVLNSTSTIAISNLLPDTLAFPSSIASVWIEKDCLLPGFAVMLKLINSKIPDLAVTCSYPDSLTSALLLIRVAVDLLSLEMVSPLASFSATRSSRFLVDPL